MHPSEEWHRAESSPQASLVISLDEESLSWLESESERTGISLDSIASAVMRRACYEQVPVGAPTRPDPPEL